MKRNSPLKLEWYTLCRVDTIEQIMVEDIRVRRTTKFNLNESKLMTITTNPGVNHSDSCKHHWRHNSFWYLDCWMDGKYLPLVTQSVARMSAIVNIFQVLTNIVDGSSRGGGDVDGDGISLMAFNFQNGWHSSVKIIRVCLVCVGAWVLLYV